MFGISGVLLEAVLEFGIAFGRRVVLHVVDGASSGVNFAMANPSHTLFCWHVEEKIAVGARLVYKWLARELNFGRTKTDGLVWRNDL